MKQVLKIRFDRADGFRGFAYVQQVTENVVVVIDDESKTTQFMRITGLHRFKSDSSMRLLDIDKINQFLEKKGVISNTWHGHWKPKFNARGEEVNFKMKDLSEFNFDYEPWFRSQEVEIINLTKGEIQVKKERVPHPFEYQGYVYDGPVKIKIEPNDTEESIRFKVEQEKLKFKRMNPVKPIRVDGHNSIAEQKARERRQARERRGK